MKKTAEEIERAIFAFVDSGCGRGVSEPALFVDISTRGGVLSHDPNPHGVTRERLEHLIATRQLTRRNDAGSIVIART